MLSGYNAHADDLIVSMQVTEGGQGKYRDPRVAILLKLVFHLSRRSLSIFISMLYTQRLNSKYNLRIARSPFQIPPSLVT